MNGFRILTVTCVAVLGVACTAPRAPAPMDSGNSIVLDGVVYTPVSHSEEGCLLYRVHIPGGQAPAALVYRSEDGAFSYAPPERCVADGDSPS